MSDYLVLAYLDGRFPNLAAQNPTVPSPPIAVVGGDPGSLN